MENFYNIRSPAVKRLMREAEELRNPTEEYYAQPVDGNLFEWHFTVRGPTKTEFDGGIYHGRITLPPDYPMKPPNILLFTPNGRFEINRKICLSISGHHPESWQPSWSIRTALLAIIGFMPTHGNGAIGSLDYSAEERQVLAERSRTWKCTSCGVIEDLLLDPEESSNENSDDQEESGEEEDDDDEEEEGDEEDDNSGEQLTNAEMTSAIPGDYHYGGYRGHGYGEFHDEFYEEEPDGLAQYFTLESSNVVIWTLVLMIAALLIRRIFYM